MPRITLGDLDCYYRLEGRENQPVLVLSHSLGLDHGMWDAQMPDLLQHLLVLRYDLRGHGASGAPAGDYTIEQLGRDALALVDALGIGKFAFCGLSIGGMIGQWLGAHAGDRLSHLVLANTSFRAADPPAMDARRRTVLERGMAAIVDTAMARFFSPAFLSLKPPRADSARRTLLATNPAGYAGCCAALRDADQSALLPRIRVPTLVVCGDLDGAMPWAGHSEVLTRSIDGAAAVRLPAAHISNIETPRAFTAAVLEFVIEAGGDVKDGGMAVRRAVLGDAWVDNAIAGTTDFTRDFQQLITTYAWGSVWSRPGLDRRTRRLLVLAMMASLGRWEEFRMHVRTALAAGFEPCDVKEVLMMVAVYAGVPAANTGFHIASEEL